MFDPFRPRYITSSVSHGKNHYRIALIMVGPFKWQSHGTRYSYCLAEEFTYHRAPFAGEVHRPIGEVELKPKEGIYIIADNGDRIPC